MATSAQLHQIMDGPALAPPDGIVPNLINPDNQTGCYILTIVICVTFSSLAVLARLYTKLRIARKIGWEDYTSFLAWSMYMGFCGTAALITNYGAGVHQWNVSVKDATELAYIANIVEILYGPTIFLVKLSILLQYLRIFVPTRNGNLITYHCIHLVIWANLILYFIDTFVEIFACSPREKIWNGLITEGYCLNINANLISTAIFNVVSDFSIFVLPLGTIWNLKMPIRQKMGVSAIFAVGFFACITSIIRLIYTINFTRSPDMTYNIFYVAVWAWVEIAVGIVCGCLPVLPKFFQHLSCKKSTVSSSSTTPKQGHATPRIVHGLPYPGSPSWPRTFSDSLMDTKNDSYDLPHMPRGNYVSLGEQDRESAGLKSGALVKEVVKDPPSVPCADEQTGQEPVAKFPDLETGLSQHPSHHTR